MSSHCPARQGTILTIGAERTTGRCRWGGGGRAAGGINSTVWKPTPVAFRQRDRAGSAFLHGSKTLCQCERLSADIKARRDWGRLPDSAVGSFVHLSSAPIPSPSPAYLQMAPTPSPSPAAAGEGNIYWFLPCPCRNGERGRGMGAAYSWAAGKGRGWKLILRVCPPGQALCPPQDMDKTLYLSIPHFPHA